MIDSRFSALSLSSSSHLSESSRFNRRDRLGTQGVRFRDSLSEFVRDEGTKFMAENEKMNIGTSVSKQ